MVRKRFIGDRNGLLTFRDMHNFQTPRALVYSDGILLSNFLGANFATAPRWDVVQPQEIDRVEIFYGPYSARYSGNSLGGVTVFHTKMPQQAMAHLSAGTFMQRFDDYGTDEDYFGHRLNAVVGNRKGDWSLLLAASRLENEGHPQSFGLTRGTGPNPGTPVTGAHPYSQGGYVYNAASGSEVTEQNLKLKLGYDLTRDLQARLTLAWLDRRDETLKPQTYLRDANGRLVYNGDVTINGQPAPGPERKPGSDHRPGTGWQAWPWLGHPDWRIRLPGTG
jgi:iron complex outermembrane receptor protein